jgi:hypothetical protein
MKRHGARHKRSNILIQPILDHRANIRPVKCERDIGGDEAGFIPAIEAAALKAKAVEWLSANHLRHRVGKLNFITRPARLIFKRESSGLTAQCRARAFQSGQAPRSASR